MSATNGDSGSTAQYHELTIPYHLTRLALQRRDGIRVGDLVSVTGLSKIYRLSEIFWKHGLVRLQELEGPEGMVLDWKFVKPVRHQRNMKSSTLTQSLGDALYRGSLVYQVDAPDRVLKVRKINWDEESSWVEDDDGKLFKLDWDETEFWEN